jgi:secondary thiamine-phosphate synthase enzyme
MNNSEKNTIWFQNTLTFKKSTGNNIITDSVIENLPEIKKIKIGMLNLFLTHTSAGITLGENFDPNVLKDFKNYLDKLVPEGDNLYLHNDEGPEDMPSHIKSHLIGQSLNIPISEGKLALGTWQGIYLCEFRSGTKIRNIVATMNGLSY